MSEQFFDDVLDLSKNTRRKYRTINNSDGTVSFEDVTVYLREGSKFGADEVNELMGLGERIDNLYTFVTGVLHSGDTSIELQSDKITSDSKIEPFFWVELGVETEPISPLTQKVEIGKITYTFDAMSGDITVGIRIS